MNSLLRSSVLAVAVASCHSPPPAQLGPAIPSAALPRPSLVPPSNPRIAVMGRVDRPDPDHLRIGYPGVTVRLRFEGRSLALRVACSTPNNYVTVLVDGGAPRVVRLPQPESDVVLAEGLPAGPHEIDVVHRTETWQGIVTLGGFLLGPGGRALEPSPWPRRRLLFIGDSVTCGEGIERTTAGTKEPSFWDAYASYGMLIGRALEAQTHLVCYGGRGVLRDWRGRRDVLNGAQFFELAIADDVAPARWDHTRYAPDAVVVSLGTNDFNLALGDLPSHDEFVEAYVGLVRAVRARHPQAHILLTEGAIVNDDADPKRPQKTVLRAYLADAARRLGDPRVVVIPSRHYPGDARDAHPTREQHAEMARDLEPVLRQALDW